MPFGPSLRLFKIAPGDFVIHREVMYAENASLQGQGLFLQPRCISTIHGGHVTY